MAAEDSSCDFKCMQLERRAVGDLDVLIDMKFCGVCHTDLHATANHMAPLLPTAYPIVPGHELVGLVAQVGPKVTKVKVGDVVGGRCALFLPRRLFLYTSYCHVHVTMSQSGAWLILV